MSKQFQKIMATSVLALFPLVSQALPIDWHGSFGVDTTLINDYRRIKSKTDNSDSVTKPGSQEVGLSSGNKGNASFQSYILKLAPTMVINDAATFFGELTTGYANGGFLGDSAQTNSGTTQNAGVLYPQNQAAGQAINLKKAYLEIYSDTATYVLGRHTYNWGLGAIYNDGKDTWDRHAYSRDGITMKLKVGNFHLSPFWAKVSNTSGGNPGFTDPSNAKEIGTGLLYDNPERDIAFGMLYGKKSNEANNSFYNSTASELTVTDLYLKKIFGKFDLTVEAPLMSGDIGTVAYYTGKMSYSAKAFLLQSNYKMSDAWTIGLDAGQVSGQGSDTGKFGALYLNPNYQVANLLFKYNLFAIKNNSTQSIYDSYITNARYFKLRSTYNSEKWTFDYALITATAMEAAKAGSTGFNHSTMKKFTAVLDQSDSLGTEVDVNARYQWNKEISIGTSLGYLITGDYFAYTNSTTATNEAQSSYVLQLNAAVSF
jgi:hypothetical protein